LTLRAAKLYLRAAFRWWAAVFESGGRRSVTLELSVHTSPMPIQRGPAEVDLNLFKLEGRP